MVSFTKTSIVATLLAVSSAQFSNSTSSEVPTFSISSSSEDSSSSDDSFIITPSASSSDETSSSSASEGTPYITGYLLDGQPHWDVFLPGSYGPFEAVSLSGSNPGSAYVFTQADLSVGGSVIASGSVEDASYSIVYEEAIEAGLDVLFAVYAEATGSAPYSSSATLTITTPDAKKLVKRATQTFELSSVIAEDAVASSTDASGAASGSSAVSSAAVTSGASVSTATATDEVTTVITTTKCSDDACSAVPVTTGVTVVTTTVSGVVTEYTTYCPLTAEPSTVTQDDQKTTVVTITSCSENKCSEVPVTTGLTVITTTTEGTVTEYTTYCPLTTAPAPGPVGPEGTTTAPAPGPVGPEGTVTVVSTITATSGAPGAPGAPGASTAPGAPAAPGASSAAPGAPAAPGTTTAPGAPGAPGAPAAPGTTPATVATEGTGSTTAVVPAFTGAAANVKVGTSVALGSLLFFLL